jgi:hypothetical protein
LITVGDGEQFTRAVNEIDIAGVVPERALGLTERNVRVELELFAVRVTCIGERRRAEVYRCEHSRAD